VYYAPEIAPGFWDALRVAHANRRIGSIDKVLEEINAGTGNGLRDWANDPATKTMFRDTQVEDVLEAYARIVRWVQANPQFTDPAKSEFMGVADGWVVAYAMAKQQIVVTHEKYEPSIKRKVKIPNVCREFGVDSVTMFDLLRDLGVRLVV
jgi:hypothetical protein